MKKAELQQRQGLNRSTVQQAITGGEMQHQLAARINSSPAMIAQRKQIEALENSPYAAAQLKKMGTLFGTVQRVEEEELLQGKFETAQRMEEEELLQGKFATEQTTQLEEGAVTKANNTGLPNQLKSGIESLSGMSMDHVQVHYNSAKPAQLNALAYAQGSDIHVASGQEKHLPHEAWHVVQQAQGRVKPTTQMKESVPINDYKGLEQEADVMGAKALATGAVKLGG